MAIQFHLLEEVASKNHRPDGRVMELLATGTTQRGSSSLRSCVQSTFSGGMTGRDEEGSASSMPTRCTGNVERASGSLTGSRRHCCLTSNLQRSSSVSACLRPDTVHPKILRVYSTCARSVDVSLRRRRHTKHARATATRLGIVVDAISGLSGPGKRESRVTEVAGLE